MDSRHYPLFLLFLLAAGVLATVMLAAGVLAIVNHVIDATYKQRVTVVEVPVPVMCAEPAPCECESLP